MLDFKRLSSRTDEEKNLDKLRLKYRLAETSLEACKSTSLNRNEVIYSAWSHLAEVPELGIDNSIFEGLQYKRANDVDYSLYTKAKDKLKELGLLIAKKEVEVCENFAK